MLAPTDCYRRNMAALGEFQPDIAAVVDAAPIPDGLTSAMGRDGSRTFLVPSAEGRAAWFGRSSMPAVTAAETLAGFTSDGANIALPGVLTGVEPLVLVGRMPPHAAVFVVERDPLQIKLAMSLHDYADLLVLGRQVFVLDGDGRLKRGLAAFFERHPGYELPTRLLPVPQRSASEITDLQGRLEEAGQDVIEVQARFVESCLARLRRRAVEPLSPTPRVAVLGVDPRPASLEQARRVARTLGKLRWTHELCIPDAPDKCHLVARLGAIERADANLALFVNGGEQSICPLLPDSMAVAAWYGPGAIVQPHAIEGKEWRHNIFAASPDLLDSLVRAGVPAGNIQRCDVAADDVLFRPVDASEQRGVPVDADVAVFMDLPDDRPQACNVNLASHIALWRALQNAMKRHVDRYHARLSGEILDEAQRESGTALADAKVREHFLWLLRTRIAPATIARAAVAALAADGYGVAVWGHNWPADGETPDGRQGAVPASAARGVIPSGDALNHVLQGVRVVLIPEFCTAALQMALDALAAGTDVVCRAPDDPFEEMYPGLADIAPHLRFYRSSRDLLDTAKRLTLRRRECCGERKAAREVVVSRHSTAERLRSIVKRVLERRMNVTPRSEMYVGNS